MTEEKYPSLLQDRHTYPREYRIKPLWRISISLLALIFIAGGLIAVVLEVVVLRASGALMWLMLALSLAVSTLGLYMLLKTLRYKVVLRSDAIEIQEIFATTRLLRTQLQGRRMVRRNNSPEEIQLIPHQSQQSHEKKIHIPSMLKTDTAFQTWMSGITDLDQEDQQRTLAEIAADTSLGSNKEERLQKLATAKKRARLLNGAAFVLSIWMIIFPQPYQLLMLVLLAMPWLALLLMKTAKGVYQIDGNTKDIKPNLAIMIFMPGLALMMRAVTDFNLVNYTPVLQMALACSLTFTALALHLDRPLRSKPVMILVFTAISFAYGYGAAGLLNAKLDHSTAETYQVQVLSKHISRGKHTSYHLQLAHWGPVRHADDVTVESELYNGIVTGGMACVALHKGSLHLPWFVVRACLG
ncbi:MAG: hypothetical protein HY254_10265 [Burkholderiales bacterium]|nr:hypothetical protein [Burkholderiales bacterium]